MFKKRQFIIVEVLISNPEKITNPTHYNYNYCISNADDNPFYNYINEVDISASYLAAKNVSFIRADYEKHYKNTITTPPPHSPVILDDTITDTYIIKRWNGEKCIPVKAYRIIDITKQLNTLETIIETLI